MAYFNGVWYLESDEPRPENPLPGACIVEIDTSKVYFYSYRKNIWYEWGAESNAASNAASTLSMTRPSLTLGNTLTPDVVENMPDTAEEEMPDTAEEEMPEDAEAAPNAADTTEDGEGE